MKVLHDGVDRVPEGVQTAVSVGSYDGIHLGHQKVLSTMVERARSEGLAPAVVTFDQHPARVIRPQNAPLLLTNHEQRLELFAGLGVEYLFLLAFDEQRSQTSDREFVSEVLADALQTRHVVVGSNFHFGKGRSGSVDTLRELGLDFGFEVSGLDLLTEDDAIEPVSSTAIRRALAGGDIASVNAMLGRPFEVRGEVTEGDKRGRQIGFPTANVRFRSGWAWPAKGVYSARARVDGGPRLPAAVNIGMRPTFHQHAEEPLLEAHLIDFDDDIYGCELSVEFVSFLRSERRFNGIDEISEQLKKDVEAARLILGA